MDDKPAGKEFSREQTVEKIHEQACSRGERHYQDPVTGYLVFTALAHRDRGSCCESGCRHCPYGYKRS